jgi:hypothetical protein
MNRFFLLCVSGLVAAACAPQQPPPPTTVAVPGSPTATTTFYDGTYEGNFAQNMSTLDRNAQIIGLHRL